MYVCFVGNVAVSSMISIYVADNSHKAIYFSFFLLLKLFLLYFFSGQINHLYDVYDSVYNNCITEKHAVVCIMTKIV